MEENEVSVKKILCKECNTINGAKRTHCYMCGNELEKNNAVEYEVKRKLNKNIVSKKIRSILNILMLIIMLIIGYLLLSEGLSYEIPSREINTYETRNYVGGDAYNYIIEASIRGGEIAGATMAKSIYICSGIVIMSIALILLEIVRKYIHSNIKK